MSLAEHEEIVIECTSVELDEFQKLDFPRFVVAFDCKKLKEMHLMDSHASNHATHHVCPINSLQFLTGFNQEKNVKNTAKSAKKQSKLMSTKIYKKRPLSTSEMLSQTLAAARSHPNFQNLKITTETQKDKKPKNKN